MWKRKPRPVPAAHSSHLPWRALASRQAHCLPPSSRLLTEELAPWCMAAGPGALPSSQHSLHVARRRLGETGGGGGGVHKACEALLLTDTSSSLSAGTVLRLTQALCEPFGWGR